MKSYSQAGQDLFVHALLPKTDGSFLEIGCSHPTELSNTYALEQLGWRGIMLDSDHDAVRLCRQKRFSPVIQEDAATIDWNDVLLGGRWVALGKDRLQTKIPFRYTSGAITNELNVGIDYLSLDVDEWTFAALSAIPLKRIEFSVITIEHDHYQRGDRLRLPNRGMLYAYGYDLIAGDIHSNGCCFEDWWVNPAHVDMTIANKFRSSGLDWKAVLWKGGVL